MEGALCVARAVRACLGVRTTQLRCSAGNPRVACPRCTARVPYSNAASSRAGVVGGVRGLWGTLGTQQHRSPSQPFVTNEAVITFIHLVCIALNLVCACFVYLCLHHSFCASLACTGLGLGVAHPCLHAPPMRWRVCPLHIHVQQHRRVQWPAQPEPACACI